MAQTEGINEKLKVSDQLGWISRMNSIRQRAEEIILNEIVFLSDNSRLTGGGFQNNQAAKN